MAKRSKVLTDVPDNIREELNTRLVGSAFSDYDAQTAWLNEQLAQHGLQISISKSAIHRYGQDFQEQFERDMSESRQMLQIAKASLQDNEDPEGVLREATIRTMQTRLLRLSTALRQLEEAGDDPAAIADISCKITRALTDLGRVDIMSQKYKDEVRKQIRAEAAQELTEELKNDGISPEVEASIRRILIGK